MIKAYFVSTIDKPKLFPFAYPKFLSDKIHFRVLKFFLTFRFKFFIVRVFNHYNFNIIPKEFKQLSILFSLLNDVITAVISLLLILHVNI